MDWVREDLPRGDIGQGSPFSAGGVRVFKAEVVEYEQRSMTTQMPGVHSFSPQ